MTLRAPTRTDAPAAAADPILPRIAAGDAAAVSECLARYGGLVWGLATRYLGPGPDAEDATQEIFVEVWKSAGRFDATLSAEPTFVALIARRRLMDVRRRAARRPAAETLPEGVPAPAEKDFLAVSDDAARAGRALAKLPPGQQTVVRLAAEFGLTHDEIAARTGLPLGTVKTHVRRGLMRIRELLDVGSAAGGDP